MKKLIFILATIVIVIACNKDKFETAPKVEIESYNTEVVARNTNLVITLKFTDKEGDLGNGYLVYMPKRLNKKPLPSGISYLDSIKQTIPIFPDNNQGTLDLNLAWANLHKGDTQNDTIIFRFVAVDRAGNKSDTVTSDKFIILNQ